MNKRVGFFGFGVAMLLGACGGGGGSSNPPPVSPAPPPPPVPPVITGPATALPAAIAGTAAPGATIVATGTPPITFAVTAGSLPNGMSLNASTGVVSGTPLVFGAFPFTVTATNPGGNASAPFSQAVEPAVPNANLLLVGNRIVSFNTNVPTAMEQPLTLSGVNAGDNIVAIARRPANGFLYGFAVTDSGEGIVYALHPATGAATALWSPSGFVLNDGVTPGPILGAYSGMHVSPVSSGVQITPNADMLRISTGNGQHFRFDLVFGLAVDGNLAVANTQMDASINGPTNHIDGLAYTNNHLNASVTTLYTIDSGIDALCIQNPPGSGTQTNCLSLSSPVDAVFGFDIAPGINSAAHGAAVSRGSATAVIRLPGETQQRLAQIDLTNGVIARDPPVVASGGITSIAIQAPSGLPMYALSSDGTQLLIFNSADPGAAVARTIFGVAPSEQLVGIDFRPSTGQLYGLAVDAAANTGSVYVIDPQGGEAFSPLPNGVEPVDDTGGPRNLANFFFGYGFDFDPVTDRIRVLTNTDVNFRIHPAQGTVVDGNPLAAGTQADTDINPATANTVGLAYTNGLDVGGNVTTAYALSSEGGEQICRLAPANAGTLTACQDLTIGGAPFALNNVVGFDIPGNVRAPASDSAVSSGTGFIAATDQVSGTLHLYEVDLITATVSDRGRVGDGTMQINGLAVGLSVVR